LSQINNGEQCSKPFRADNIIVVSIVGGVKIKF